MGTIVDKFNYSFEAKDLIKDSINNLGGSITSETELKEYAEELDNIYDNLPKTTGEDTNLSLTTLKGKMSTQIKGDTKQDTTTGKNKLPTISSFSTSSNSVSVTSNGLGTITITGTATANTSVMKGNLSNTYLIQVNDYFHCVNTGTASSGSILLYDSNDTLIGSSSLNANNKVFSISSYAGQTIAKVGFYFNSGSTTGITMTPMVVNNVSTATDYEQYTGRYCFT